MEYRYLGRSGLKITEITYGNWLTHGSQVENDVATACVRAALDAGITTFDTADAYANGAAEEVLGAALASERRESLEVFTKVYWPVGPKGPNDTGLSRKHIMEGINNSLRRLNMDYVDLYQAHRYDYETPLEETIQRLRRRGPRRQGPVHWRVRMERRAAAGGSGPGPRGRFLARLQPAAVLGPVARHRTRGHSRLDGAGHVPGGVVAHGPGRAQRQVPARVRPCRRDHAPRTSTAARTPSAAFLDDDILTNVQKLRPIADELGLSMPQLAIAWVLQNPNVATATRRRLPPRAGCRERQGLRREDPGRTHDSHRHRPGTVDRQRPGQDGRARPRAWPSCTQKIGPIESRFSGRFAQRLAAFEIIHAVRDRRSGPILLQLGSVDYLRRAASSLLMRAAQKGPSYRNAV